MIITRVPDPNKADGKLGTGSFAGGVPGGGRTPVPNPNRPDGYDGPADTTSNAVQTLREGPHVTYIPDPNKADGKSPNETPITPPGPSQDMQVDWAGTDLNSMIGFFSYGALPGIETIEFDTAHSLAGFDIESTTELTTISFPNLIDIDPSATQGGYLTVINNSALTSISLPVFVPNDGNTYNLSGNALTAASVNAILARFVADAGYVSGSIDLSGGTNAAPTGQGATDVSTLTGRGVSVTTN